MKKRIYFITTVMLAILFITICFGATERELKAGDVNGDGVINTMDAVLLAQYLAKWDVTLGGETEAEQPDDTVIPDDTKPPESPARPVTESLAYEPNDDMTCIVTGIGNYSSEELIIPERINGYTVTGIAQNAFRGQADLTSVIIPETVTYIGHCAFLDCSNIKSMTLPIIGDGTEENSHFGYIFGANFSDYNDDYVPSSLKNVVITSVEYIDDRAFAYCKSITDITLPQSLSKVGYSAFYQCTFLKNVYISDLAKWCEIMFLDGQANPLYYAENFYVGGNLLNEIVIPEGVEAFGWNTFHGYNGLKRIDFSSTVKSIPQSIIRYCTNLEKIEVAKDNEYFASVDGVLFSNDMTKIIQYPSAKSGSEYIIPEGVTYIGEYAFHACKNLKTVNICKTVTSIGWYAFYNCPSLQSIEIPSGVSHIGDYTFFSCESLATVVIPVSVKTFGDYPFQYCDSLNTVYYGGTSAKWYALSVPNDLLKANNIYFYAETKPENQSGVILYDYWRYVDGIPTPW